MANLTRGDGHEFFERARRTRIRTTTSTYALGDANTALDDLRNGRFTGAAVLVP